MAKFCMNCGKPLEENDSFCTGCGCPVGNEAQNNEAPQPETPAQENPVNDAPVQEPAPQTQNQQNGFRQEYVPPVTPAPAQPVNKPTGILGWIGWRILCSFIPIIGSIIMICCADDKAARNYAIVTLIFKVIAIAISVVIIILFGAALWEFATTVYNNPEIVTDLF